MVRANAEITFCGPCGAASRKEIEFRELGRDSVSCFSAVKKKIRGRGGGLVHVNCFNRPAFSTIDGLAVRAYYIRNLSPAFWREMRGVLSLLTFAPIVFCKIDQFE